MYLLYTLFYNNNNNNLLLLVLLSLYFIHLSLISQTQILTDRGKVKSVATTTANPTTIAIDLTTN